MGATNRIDNKPHSIFLQMNQQILKRGAGIFGMICLLSITLTSCLKDHNDYVPQQPVALISAINASPDAANVDFYLDQNKGNNQPVETGKSLDYIRAYTGKRNVSFSIGSGQKIKTDTVTLRADKFYSLFLSNLVAKPDFLLIADSIARPASGMATVRLVNLSPNVASADLAITGGAVLASGKAYKTYSSFIPVMANTSTSFEVRTGGTSTVLASLPNVNIRPGSVYTIWIQGYAGATDQTKLSAHIQNNVYYY